MHTMQQKGKYAIAAGKPGGGFGAAASGQTSTTKENGGFSFKPANPSPAGDCFSVYFWHSQMSRHVVDVDAPMGLLTVIRQSRFLS